MAIFVITVLRIGILIITIPIIIVGIGKGGKECIEFVVVESCIILYKREGRDARELGDIEPNIMDQNIR